MVEEPQQVACLDEVPDVELVDERCGHAAAVDRWLTGLFSGYVRRPDGTIDECDELPLREALAWAWARAPRVILRLGDDPRAFDAGRHAPGDLERWPPEDVPLPLRRRRPPDERWKDRTLSDPPIAWTVTVALRLPEARWGELAAGRARCEAEVAAIAARCGADGVDAAEVDGWIADLQAAADAAPPGRPHGWTTTHQPAWLLRLAAIAPTRERAAAAARERVGDLPGWEVAAVAEPAAPAAGAAS